MTAHPNPNLPSIRDPYLETHPEPAPGGLRRFLIAMFIALLFLGGVAFGMAYWMKATEHNVYEGPPKLTYPEKRPFR